MTMTTIKVSITTRDRLKKQAAAAEKSLGAYLDDLASRADRAERFRILSTQIDGTSTELLESYRAETELWARAESADAHF